MNERIKELAEQAMGTRKHVPPVWQFYDIELEKFVELIVKECLDLSIKEKFVEPHYDSPELEKMLKKHFGVE